MILSDHRPIRRPLSNMEDLNTEKLNAEKLNTEKLNTENRYAPPWSATV